MGELYKRDEGSYTFLHDKIVKGNEEDVRSKLSEEFHGRLEKVENDVKLNIGFNGDEKNWLIDYLVKAFLMLGKLQRLSNEDVKKYCELMLTERRFLEYEVYHALLTLGVPAVPNVIVNKLQIDVLAVYNSVFWFFEVTTRTSLNDLTGKINDLLEIARLLQNARVIFVCHNETCKKLKNEGVIAIPLENLYDPQKGLNRIM